MVLLPFLSALNPLNHYHEVSKLGDFFLGNFYWFIPASLNRKLFRGTRDELVV